MNTGQCQPGGSQWSGHQCAIWRDQVDCWDREGYQPQPGFTMDPETWPRIAYVVPRHANADCADDPEVLDLGIVKFAPSPQACSRVYTPFAGWSVSVALGPQETDGTVADRVSNCVALNPVTDPTTAIWVQTDGVESAWVVADHACSCADRSL